MNKNNSLEVINSTAIDYEAIAPTAILMITVKATDSGPHPLHGLSHDFCISVLDANEPPSDIRIQQSSILENVSVGYCLEITCYNPEPYQKLNFTLLSTYSNTFVMRETCGNRTRGSTSVFLTVMANLKYDVKRTYDFMIAVDDGHNGNLTELVSLNISRVDPCPQVTDCHVNASCYRIDGRKHKCVCNLGYAGDGYEKCVDIDECLENPCVVGNCTDLLHNYTCDCPNGYQVSYSLLPLPFYLDWMGNSYESYLPQCEEINECEANPCKNGAACTDSLNNYTCSCLAGFNGRTCSINIDECEVYGCNGHGNCIDSIDKFTCQCQDEYSGTQCQRLKRHCHPNPCERENMVCVQPANWHHSFPPPMSELCALKSSVIQLVFPVKSFTYKEVKSSPWKFKLQNFIKSYVTIPISELNLDAGDVNNTVGLADIIFIEIVGSHNRENTEVKFIAKADYSRRKYFLQKSY